VDFLLDKKRVTPDLASVSAFSVTADLASVSAFENEKGKAEFAVTIKIRIQPR